MWIVLLLFLPWITALVYLIARGKGMTQRTIGAERQAKEQADACIQSVAGKSAADQIVRRQALLDPGTITDAEFAASRRRHWAEPIGLPRDSGPPAHPSWSALIITLDVVVIWAIIIGTPALRLGHPHRHRRYVLPHQQNPTRGGVGAVRPAEELSGSGPSSSVANTARRAGGVGEGRAAKVGSDIPARGPRTRWRGR